MIFLDSETRAYLSATHPLLGYGVAAAIILFLAAVMAAFFWGLWSLLPLSVLLLAVTVVVAQARVRFARFVQATPQIVERLWQMAGLSADDQFMLIDIGSNATVRSFAQHLRYGQLRVINIFNPQIIPGPAFIRARQYVARQQVARQHVARQHVPDQTPIQADPRIVWFNARIDLLPFPDATIDTIVTNQVLSEMPYAPDRATLITEIHRILRPGGRWLSSERIVPATNAWLFGIGRHAPESADAWVAQIQPHGMVIRSQTQINPIVVCISLQKPGQDPPRQLRFAF